MDRINVWIILACLALGACRTGGIDKENSSRPKLPSNETVIALAYDTSYQVPDTFYRDDRADTEGSYTIYHVKDSSNSYELCTDDIAQALAWEDDDNSSRGVNGIYVGEHENEMYFEAVRELAYPDSIGNIDPPVSPGYSRVFKCSYVSRNGVDRHVRTGYAGTLNARPLNKEALSDLVEYLWQFTFFWPAKKTVVDSYSVDTGDTFEHILLLGLVTNQGTESCDLVQLIEWEFSVKKGSGEISKAFNILREFEAQLVSGSPELCPG